MTNHNPQEAPETHEPHSTQDPTGKGPGRGGEVGMVNGWGLTRNMRGVRRVVDAVREVGSYSWNRKGWRDAKGFVPDGAFFETKAEAIAFARKQVQAAAMNAEKMVANAKRDMAKLDKLAAQPE